MSDSPVLKNTPHLPQDDKGPVFAAPWEARAFAMTVDLHKQGLFDWSEWCETLSAEIKAAQAAGDPDLGDTYYHHWLGALEKLVARKQVATKEELSSLRADWRAADEERGFGEAPMLKRGAASARNERG